MNSYKGKMKKKKTLNNNQMPNNFKADALNVRLCEPVLILVHVIINIDAIFAVKTRREKKISATNGDWSFSNEKKKIATKLFLCETKRKCFENVTHLIK